mgnify:FL=1|jgi:hypothetical protein|tara:strand:- start:216 stop:464 length:249 start_codon:yes stop_codon:yes gene_type:complete
MKKVEFDLTFEVHKKLDEEDLEILLKNYLINDYTIEDFVSSVLGEEDGIDNFSIDSVNLSRKKKKKKSKISNGVPDKRWDVV